MVIKIKIILIALGILCLVATGYAETITPNQWTTHGPDGGLIYSLAISPNYSDAGSGDQTVYVGTDGGGVFKTTNGGANWSAVNSGISDTYIYSLAISPNYASDHTVYAGTGGGGIFKTTNGGASWSAVNSGVSDTYIYSLAISPNYANDQAVYAGTYGGGIFRTTNGGASWSAVNSGISDTYIYSVTMSPNYVSDQTVYAGTDSGGVFKTTNGGASWSAVSSGLTNLSIASLAMSPNYVSDHTVYAGTNGGGVFKTTNGGASWSAVNSGVTSTYIRSLAMSPNYVNDHTVYAGTSSGGVFKTTNGGANWSVVSQEVPNKWISSLAMSPNYVSDQTIYAGTNGGGVVKTTNGGIQWSAVNSGISDTFIYSLAMSPNYVSDQTVYAGTGGGGVFKTTNGSASWSAVNSGVPNTWISSLAMSHNYSDSGSGDRTVYAGTNGGWIFKTTNGGTSWRAVHSEDLNNNTWINSLAMSPNYSDAGSGAGPGDQTVYAGTNDGRVLKTIDGGENWITVDLGVTNPSIASLAISPTYASDQTVYAGTDGGGIFKSTNGGASWSSVNSGVTNLSIASLAISPTYAIDQTVYAGTNGGGLFKTTDGGVRWGPISPDSSGFTNTVIPALAVSGRTVYAGTHGGGVFKATTAPDINISPAPINFGNGDGAAPTTQSFTLTNTGMSDLTISSIALSGGNSGMFSITTGSCAGLTPKIKLGSNCTINVTFSPTSSGTKSTTLVVMSDAVTFPALSIPLNGAGLSTSIITPTVNSGGTISPASQIVDRGATTTFTVTPDAGHSVSIGGTCGGTLSGNTYTTNAITGPCTVAATFTLNRYTVTPSAGAGGTISPATPQTVNYGATITFMITPATGYAASIDGTCGGTRNGIYYTTSVITAPCAVAATFGDTSAPTGFLSINTGAAFTNNLNVALNLSASDIGSGVSRMCISNVASCTAWETFATTKNWALTSGDATKTVYMKLKDVAGNESAAITASIVLDTTPPELTISTLPDGSTTNNATPNISGTVTDLSGIADLTINDQSVAIDQNGGFSHALTLMSGANSITATATDAAGNQATDTRTINLKPAITVTITAPSDNSKTKQSAVRVAGTVDVASTVKIRLNEGAPVNAPMNGKNFGLTISPLAYGVNTIEVTASTTTGDRSTVKRTITYDNLVPSISITEPAQDITTGQNEVMVRGSVSDITAVTVTITASDMIYRLPVTDGTFEQQLAFTEEGTYTVYVTATDELGNSATVQRNIIYSLPKTLEVVLHDAEGGSVTGGTAIDCPDVSCADTFDASSHITLTALPADGYMFTGWNGCDTTTGKVCTIVMNADTTVTASFVKTPEVSGKYILVSILDGYGNGAITSSTAGINCNGKANADCENTYNKNTQVKLTAKPLSDSIFKGWSGVPACEGKAVSTCTVTMNNNYTITAKFELIPQYTLGVIKSGSGQGTITAKPGGLDNKINCGNDCLGGSSAYFKDKTVTLTAKAASGSIFKGWSGYAACEGNTTATCTVRMDKDYDNIIAAFDEIPVYTVTVSPTGTGTGTITGSSKGKDGKTINCGTNCSENYVVDKTVAVTLTAKPGSGSKFSGWGGDVPVSCSGKTTATCKITGIDSDRSITATFGKPDISVSATEVGTGTVTKAAKNGMSTFAINNTGDAELKITGIKLTGAAKLFKIFNDSTGKAFGATTIAAGDSLTVKVSFTPASNGLKTALLKITSDDPINGTGVSVTLTGTGSGFAK